MSRLALPSDRWASGRAAPRSPPTATRVFRKPNGVESEPGSDFSSEVTSDVTSDIPDFRLVPPSPGALENLEQGTLGAVVGGAERSSFPVCFSHLASFLQNPPP